MISFTVQVNTDPILKLLRATPAELRRATRNVLNDATRAAQREIVAQAMGRFDVRSPAFLKRSIYIGPEDKATVEKLAGRVRMNPDRGDIYARHDVTGPGLKTVLRGNRLAVPSRGILAGGGHVAKGYAFSSFRPFVTQGGAVTRLRKKGGQLVGGRTTNLRAQVVGRRGSFLMQLRGGAEALVQRKRGEELKVLYVFRPSVRLQRRLEFQSAAQAGVDREWQRLVDRELANALRRIGG